MLGAIAGDIIGSAYEHHPIKTTDFPLFGPGSRFTDDTVLTVAVAHALLEGGDYVPFLKDYAETYPHAGYGGAFFQWALSEDAEPYNSWGNGSAMRVSPVAYAFDSHAEVRAEAARSAAVTHSHPEGIRGAEATATAVYLARTGHSKADMRTAITHDYGYDLGMTLDGIRPGYAFDVSCQGTVPPAVIAFLESDGYEDAVRKAVSLGGDSDTLACITGGIAGAYYGVPENIAERALAFLPGPLRDIVTTFDETFGVTARQSDSETAYTIP
jgi:ADP-ribosylglycohydrolase